MTRWTAPGIGRWRPAGSPHERPRIRAICRQNHPIRGPCVRATLAVQVVGPDGRIRGPKAPGPDPRLAVPLAWCRSSDGSSHRRPPAPAATRAGGRPPSARGPARPRPPPAGDSGTICISSIRFGRPGPATAKYCQFVVRALGPGSPGDSGCPGAPASFAPASRAACRPPRGRWWVVSRRPCRAAAPSPSAARGTAPGNCPGRELEVDDPPATAGPPGPAGKRLPREAQPAAK